MPVPGAAELSVAMAALRKRKSRAVGARLNLERWLLGYPFTSLRATLFYVGENQNVTLSVPRELLKRAKRLAADRDTSVSALLTEALARLTDEDRRYSAARKRALRALKSASSLGTRGQRRWTRDQLHER